MMSHFLWPEARFDYRSVWRARGATAASVEACIANLYPNACPVLFPSARAGLAAAIAVHGLGRPDLVWLPPYSSHCVIDAVSRVATPTSSFSDGDVAAALVFHQWGYPHDCAFGGGIIEDSADSLCVPGADLFPNGGRFALWSLPKVIGSALGGVVFCRSAEDATELKGVRDGRHAIGWIQFALKVLCPGSAIAQVYWQGAEALNGHVPGMACNDILTKLTRLDWIIDDRRKKLAMFEAYLPDWLRFDPLRLPSNVPLECSMEQEAGMKALGASAGFRRFNRRQACEHTDLVKVLPVPIHQDVSIAELEVMIKVLELRSATTSSGSKIFVAEREV